MNYLISSRQLASAWLPAGSTLLEMSVGYVEAARRAGAGTPAGKAYLAEARKVLIKGLASAPADGFGWARLAYVRQALGEAPEDVLRDLQLSFETTRFDRRMMMFRLDMAFALRHLWGPEMTDLMVSQVRMAWVFDVSGVAFMSVRRGGVPFMRATLPPGPGGLDLFENIIR